jgi:hypothetical protein
MCALSIAFSVAMLCVEGVLYWRMRKLRAKWIAETKRYQETLAKLGIPSSIL